MLAEPEIESMIGYFCSAGTEDSVIEKDVTEKLLEDYNDVFADIINVLLFDGQRIIQPEELSEGQVHSQYKAGDDKLHEQERDIVKYWKRSNVRLAVFGIENQTMAEKEMPLRIMGYDGASYRSQLLVKTQKFTPVISIVLYFGDRRWRYPKNLKGVLEIPAKLEPFVSDYFFQVFEIAWLTDEQIEKFQSDFKVVANFFVKKRRNRNYIPDDVTEIQHVDELLKLLSAMTRDEKYELISADQLKGGVSNMCEVAERLWNSGKLEGKQEGKLEGKIEGKIEGENMLAALMTKLFSLGRIADAEHAARDKEARQLLYREFNMI